MKYCPDCGTEYLDTVLFCTDCSSSLVNELKWKKIQETKIKEDGEVFINVKIAENQFEADVIKDALEKENIPVLVRTFSDTSFDGIYIQQKGWGTILVPKEFEEQAKRVLDLVESDGE